MKKSTGLIFVFSLLWLLFILILYYSTHKPLSPDVAVDLIMVLWRSFSAAILVALGGAIGYRVVHFDTLNPLTSLSLQAALGLGILATLFFLTGVSVGLPVWLPWLAVGLLGMVFFKSFLEWIRQWGALKDYWGESTGFGRVVAVLVTGMLFSSLLFALAPPIRFDALLYHLTMPEAYLRLGRVAHLPWIAMTGHPQTTEMLYTWAISLGGRQAAATLGWSFGVLTLIGLAGYIRQRINTGAAWIGVGALMSGYTLAISMGWAYVDWLGLYFGLGCLVALDRWGHNGEKTDLLLAGAFAGLALSTKYTAGVLGLVGLGTVAWQAYRHRRSFIPAAVNFCLVGGIFVIPWLLKNFITTGNPFYPFFFPAAEMDATRIAIYQGSPPFGNWLDFLFLPLRATMLGVDGGNGYSVAVGPLLLGLGIFAWIKQKNVVEEQKSAFEAATVFSLLGVIVWAVGNQFSGYLIQTRMYYPLFPAFAMMVAFGYSALSTINFKNIRLGRIINAIVLMVLFLNVFEIGTYTLKTSAAQAALGIKSEQAYLADNLGWFQPAMESIRDLPEGSQVLLIYEPRSLYCAPICLPDEILDRWIRDFTILADDDEILAKWTREGFSHILVYRSGVEFLKEDNDPHHPLESLNALDNFLQNLADPVSFGGVYELYSLEKGSE